jgi:hypothetical protein
MLHHGLGTHVLAQNAPMLSLPVVTPPKCNVNPSLPTFLTHDPLQFVGYIDAALATDLKTHQSVSGYVFTLTGGAGEVQTAAYRCYKFN